ncbi:SDR family NAD(P)-dependent oxidoreductase [Thermococcus sp.]|uniref:SDR family NAD(P)-dependent oxidoreductase n=1 Tax=Thermococcus sp. TaxID=35749 RepID=UPI00262377F0|nr:SDR family NAD(P)-dependent oxidoreductase [Thermococcus sp.]
MKIALVTGVTGGIGRELAVALLREGYFVVGVARNLEKLKEMKNKLGERFEFLVADLLRQGSSEKVAEGLRDLGIERLDVLVNNAGYGLRKPLIKHSPEELEGVFKLNALFPVILTRELLPFMGQGSTVVFVISGVAFVNAPELPSYCASKAALHSMALNLAGELGKLGISVMRVYPKQVKTDFWDGKVPRGSIGPEKVARAIVKGLEAGKSEVFVPGYLKLLKYLPGWPAFTYRFKY